MAKKRKRSVGSVKAELVTKSREAALTAIRTFNDPQVQHLGVVRQTEHPRLGTLDVVRQPVNLSNRPQPQVFRHYTPDAGEHTDALLKESGLSDAEIAELRAEGVL